MGEFAAKYRPAIDLDEFERRLRAAAPGPQSPYAQGHDANAPVDPLAELARLVGGDGQGKKEDPFEALFRAQKAVSEIRGAPTPLQASLQAPHEPYFGSQQAQAGYGHAEAGYYHDEPQAFASDPLPYEEAEPQWADAHLPVAAGAEDWPDPHYDEPPAAPAASGKRKVTLGMAMLLVAGVVGIGATLAMRGKSSQDAPVIQASSDPAKVRPDAGDASGAGNGQALFDGKTDGTVAKVVSHVEQPADLGAAVKAARVVGAGETGAPPPVPAPPPAAAPQGSQGDAIFPSPKKVKTVSVRADGSLIDGSDSKPPLARNVPSMVGGFPPSATTSAPRGPTAQPKAATTKLTDRAAVTSTTQAALQAPARPKPAASAATPVAAPATVGSAGAWAVQLSSSPSEADARASASSLSAKYSGVLQGRHAASVTGDKDGKPIYRVRISHMSEDAAKTMCMAIKGQGGACFATKN